MRGNALSQLIAQWFPRLGLTVCGLSVYGSRPASRSTCVPRQAANR